MKISLITPTGGRPEAFALCEELIKRQTIKHDEWIVIDDSTPPTKCTMGQKYIRGPREWTPGYNTHRGNMEVGLKEVTGDVIFFVEDDDHFAPNYIEAMLSLLRNSAIAGLGTSRYYHLKTPGWLSMINYAHASLSQTVIRKSLLPTMIEAVNSGDLFFDIYLWRKARENKVPWTLLHNSNISVGMKAMPGRLGITRSHTDKNYFHDGDYSKLKEWIGDDIKYYLPYLKPRREKFTPPIKGAIQGKLNEKENGKKGS